MPTSILRIGHEISNLLHEYQAERNADTERIDTLRQKILNLLLSEQNEQMRITGKL